MSDDTIRGDEAKEPEFREPIVVDSDSGTTPAERPVEEAPAAHSSTREVDSPVGSATGQVDPVEPDPEPVPAPEPVAAPEPATGPKVVYVQAAVPPRPKGNRVVGALLALLGALI